MLSISPEAHEHIRKRNEPIHLDMPPVVSGGCCVSVQECPEVRFGRPRDPKNYDEMTIQGIPVFVPHRMPMERKYVIKLSKLFGFRWVVLEGWSPF